MPAANASHDHHDTCFSLVYFFFHPHQASYPLHQQSMITPPPQSPFKLEPFKLIPFKFLPVMLEKDTAGHGKQNASSRYLAPAPTTHIHVKVIFVQMCFGSAVKLCVSYALPTKDRYGQQAMVHKDAHYASVQACVHQCLVQVDFSAALPELP